MESSPKATFKAITEKISNLPLWVKQVIYLQLKDEFNNLSIWSSLNLFNKDDCLQLYVPKITFMGKKELDSKTKKLDPNIYKLLADAADELNIVEIAIKNGWHLAECAGIFVTAAEAELLANPTSIFVMGTAQYLSDRIRIGEYFVKLGKVNLDQLNETLKAQKYIEETLQDKLKLGTILTDLKLATKEEIEGVVLLKEESKKRYTSEIITLEQVGDNTFSNYKKQIADLESENTRLKEKLNKILNIKK
jgi:hypothetical protein